MIKLLLYLFIRMKHCISLYSKICLFIHSFIHSFIYSFIHSLIPLKIPCLALPCLFVFSGIVHWAIPEKSKWGLRTWNFHGYWRKNMWKFQGSVDKEVGVFSRGVKKTCGISMGSWFLTLEYSRCVTQFCRISRG